MCCAGDFEHAGLCVPCQEHHQPTGDQPEADKEGSSEGWHHPYPFAVLSYVLLPLFLVLLSLRLISTLDIQRCLLCLSLFSSVGLGVQSVVDIVVALYGLVVHFLGVVSFVC